MHFDYITEVYWGGPRIYQMEAPTTKGVANCYHKLHVNEGKNRRGTLKGGGGYCEYAFGFIFARFLVAIGGKGSPHPTHLGPNFFVFTFMHFSEKNG